MGKYKEQNNTQKTAEFLRFEHDKPKKLHLDEWDFSRHPAGYCFKAYVLKEDGEEVDKIWTVWDYHSSLRLKKALSATPVLGGKEITVVMKHDEEEGEDYFEIL